MNTKELVIWIRDGGCLVFGAGFVATLFRDALKTVELDGRVHGYLATHPDAGDCFDGHAVQAVDDASLDRSMLVCIAVHEANLLEAQRAVEAAGFVNVVWIYPHLYDLIYGEPVYRDVTLPLRMILQAQDPAWNWVSVRALAAQGIMAGDGECRELYLSAQSLHCSRETAAKRHEKLCALVSSMRESGFDASRPVLVDTNLNIIDGLHRVAAAWVLGIEAIPCHIVNANDAFDRLLSNRNKMTCDQLEHAGLSPEQIDHVQALGRRMRLPGDNAPEVSFIIPAYNVAGYIDQCLESVVAQTFADFEVLLIDDGSTDGTGQRCDEWTTRDSRMFAIHKSNSGVSPSRNLGIDLARGTYLAFADPDDWLDARYLEKLHDAAVREDADFAECDIWRYDNRTGKKIHRFCGQRMGVRYTLEEHMKYGPTASYKAISKRSLWVGNDVRFPSCSFESPAVYALILALADEKSAYLPEPLYYYRRFRENSLVETAYAKAPGVADNTLGVEAMRHLLEQFRKRGLYERFAQVMPEVVAYRLNDILAMQYHRRSEGDFSQLVANQRRFLAEAFPQLPQGAYITWGGYNLNKILQHLPLLNDPSCRFNFSSIAAIAFEGAGGGAIAHHPNRYRQMMVQRELDRAFWSVLKQQEPHFIFMDLIDERFDLLECSGRYITASDAFEGATLEGFEPERRIIFGSDEHLTLWNKAFDRFVRRLQAEAPDCRLVVVENYLSERVGNADGTRPFGDSGEIARTNATLERLYAIVRSIAPAALMVPARSCEGYFTDSEYEYGAVPQHLNEIVNSRIAQTIKEAVLS